MGRVHGGSVTVYQKILNVYTRVHVYTLQPYWTYKLKLRNMHFLHEQREGFGWNYITTATQAPLPLPLSLLLSCTSLPLACRSNNLQERVWLAGATNGQSTNFKYRKIILPLRLVRSILFPDFLFQSQTNVRLSVAPRKLSEMGSYWTSCTEQKLQLSTLDCRPLLPKIPKAKSFPKHLKNITHH